MRGSPGAMKLLHKSLKPISISRLPQGLSGRLRRFFHQGNSSPPIPAWKSRAIIRAFCHGYTARRWRRGRAGAPRETSWPSMRRPTNVRRTGWRALGKWIPSVLLGRACLWGTHVGTRRSSRGRGSEVGGCREESSRENAKRGAGKRHIYSFVRGGFQCPVRLNACPKPRRQRAGRLPAALLLPKQRKLSHVP
jgi:hypothetical protein